MTNVSTIFLAVIWFNMFEAILEEKVVSNVRGFYLLIHALLWAVISYLSIRLLRNHPHFCAPWAHLCTHITGFAGVYGFSFMQQKFWAAWCSSPPVWWSFFVVAVASGFFAVLFAVTDR